MKVHSTPSDLQEGISTFINILNKNDKIHRYQQTSPTQLLKLCGDNLGLSVLDLRKLDSFDFHFPVNLAVYSLLLFLVFDIRI